MTPPLFPCDFEILFTRVSIHFSRLILVLASLALCNSVCHAADNSGILLQIVQHCVNINQPDYCDQCRAPQRAAGCKGKNTCQATSEIWAESDEFVALRDIKMCGCPDDFVHGLVLPKSVISGIEDDLRPNAIWQFAWDVALQRMPVNEIALAVNSKSKRTQNQLHVHLVRLNPNAQTRIAASVVGVVSSLDDVWQFASQQAMTRHMNEYGVLVAANEKEGFRVALTTESPEGQFTQAVCSP